MLALSSGDIGRAQEVLLTIADQQQPQAGLYQEIGGLARELHTSLKSFLETLDPLLTDMVEDKIPDSGNRLEHMMQLTEKAANTTLDQVEAIQERLKGEKRLLERFEAILEGLPPEKISEARTLVLKLRAAFQSNNEALDTIVAAQDFQDLSGQIILKITQLLKELEKRLVNVIRTFGVRIGEGELKPEVELYGPAHEQKEALHSQDDVDSLLAEFGF